MKLASIRCLSVLFSREPQLIIASIDRGQNLQSLINVVKDADPEIVQEGILFWEKFIMLESVSYREDFRKKLFEQ